MNNFKTTLLLGLLTGVLLFIGGAFGGQSGMALALVFAVAINFGTWWFSDKVVLAMHGAKPLTESDAPEIHGMVANLVQKAGIPMPRLYLVQSPSPNAFATGRNPEHAAVAVTTGLVKLMSRDELEGVLAHELSHVRNRDTLISAVAASVAGAIMFLANIARFAALFGGMGSRDDDDNGGLIGLLAMAILAPIAALLIQMAISRSREYQADASAARMVGHPQGLASALGKLGAASKRIPMRASPAMGHLYIVSAFSGRSLMRVFSTHPPLEERIKRLLAGSY